MDEPSQTGAIPVTHIRLVYMSDDGEPLYTVNMGRGGEGERRGGECLYWTVIFPPMHPRNHYTEEEAPSTR